MSLPSPNKWPGSSASRGILRSTPWIVRSSTPKGWSNSVAPRWLIAAYRPVTHAIFAADDARQQVRAGKLCGGANAVFRKNGVARRLAFAATLLRTLLDWAASSHGLDLLKVRRRRARTPSAAPLRREQHCLSKVLDCGAASQWTAHSRTLHCLPGICLRSLVVTRCYRGHRIYRCRLNEEDQSALEQPVLPAHINSLGKHAAAFLARPIQWVRNGSRATLPFGFTTIPRPDASFEQIAQVTQLTQALDDFGDALGKPANAFDRVSTYGTRAPFSPRRTARPLAATAIPYRRRTASPPFYFGMSVYRSQIGKLHTESPSPALKEIDAMSRSSTRSLRLSNPASPTGFGRRGGSTTGSPARSMSLVPEQLVSTPAAFTDDGTSPAGRPECHPSRHRKRIAVIRLRIRVIHRKEERRLGGVVVQTEGKLQSFARRFRLCDSRRL